MKNLGFKSTLYDILGYIFPGFLMIFSCVEIIDIKYGGFISGYNETLLWVSMTLVCYYVGFMMSFIASLVFEKTPIKKLNKIENIATDLEWEQFSSLFKNRFKVKDSRNIFAATVWVNENSGKAYETAFVFMSFYGMARNICLISLFAMVLSFNYGFHVSQVFFAFIALISIFMYRKFWKTFNKTIFWAFIAHKDS